VRQNLCVSLNVMKSLFARWLPVYSQDFAYPNSSKQKLDMSQNIRDVDAKTFAEYVSAAHTSPAYGALIS
jgi:hypothetical protein